MPIQILELTIKVVIENEKQQKHLARSFGGEELIEECTERVLKRLEELKER